MKNKVPSLLQTQLQQSDKSSKFLMISFGVHALMLILLFGTGFYEGQKRPPSIQMLKQFNVDLIDVTMEDVKYNPQEVENLKTVRQKTKKSETASPKTVAKTKSLSTANADPNSVPLAEEDSGDPSGQDSGNAQGVGDAEGESRRILMSYRDYLINYLNNTKGYPRIAEKLRQEGKVVLELEIDAKGLIKELKIKSSSNFKILDTAALDHVRSLSPFKELPTATEFYRVEVPIVYQIN